MNAFKKFGRRLSRDFSGHTIKSAIRSAEKTGKKVASEFTGRGMDQQSGGTTNQGPQFTDAARQQAAGAGTVGFTQRTQNY